MDVRTEQFDTLYSANKNGSVQQWTISVSGATITKVYGQVKGALQTTADVILKGKNWLMLSSNGWWQEPGQVPANHPHRAV